MTIGTIAELSRYPVKSMLGESLQQAMVTTSGLFGDRAFALIDVKTGKVASAKLPHRWRKLLEYKACYADKNGDNPCVIDPDGRELNILADSFNTEMSAGLGREVVLAAQRQAGQSLDRADPDSVLDKGDDGQAESKLMELGAAAPEGGFFDFAPLHIVTSPSLDEIAAITASGRRDTARFRPNIVIEYREGAPFAENMWAGGTLKIGTVKLQVIVPTPRCAVPTLEHGPLKPDPNLTRELGKVNPVEIPEAGKLACLGVYAKVTETGQIAIGDEVQFSPAE